MSSTPDLLPLSPGPLRDAYEAVDWGSTHLGPPAVWPPELRGAADLLLSTRFPAALFWGPELVLLYNEAFVQLIGEKHPGGLGRPGEEVFAEAWAQLGPLFEAVRAGREATWRQDEHVPLVRHGFLEDCWFTFSYSPVRAADGRVAGVLDIAAETTELVLANRRLGLLERLRAALAGVTAEAEVLPRALPVLRAADGDLAAVEVHPGTERTVPAGVAIEVEQDETGRTAWLPLGRGTEEQRPPLLEVRLNPRLPVDGDQLAFLRLLAGAVAQARDRTVARQAERELSESLQRSLLTAPVQPDHLDVAVRYRPAAVGAEVGGDWYDAFLLPSGALVLSVGDVAGHDRASAAAMAQVRNLLRGVAFTLDGPPSAAMSALDDAMRGLGVDAIATSIVARVEQDPDDAAAGLRTLRWSNAGHPPPVLVDGSGEARLLTAPPELLLGLDASERSDHTVTLDPGSTVVLYSDGLVERRDVPYAERLRWLTTVAASCRGLSAEETCDRIMGELEADVEDDVVLLVLHAWPEDRPRPAAAGPRVLPEDLREL